MGYTKHPSAQLEMFTRVLNGLYVTLPFAQVLANLRVSTNPHFIPKNAS